MRSCSWVALVLLLCLVSSYEDSVLWPPQDLSDRVESRSSGILRFDGSAQARQHVVGGHALKEFTLMVHMRSKGCLEEGWHNDQGVFVKYDKGAWYTAGCSLFNGVVSATPGATWKAAWRKRRACCAVGVDDELISPAGNRGWRGNQREHVKQALFRGSRSDFGLSLSGTSLIFGVGHRDFAYRTRSGRPVRDVTVEAKVDLLDDEWHTVVAVRSATELALYVDGRRLETHERTNGGVNATAAFEVATAAGGLHTLHDAAHWVALGQLYRGCLRDATLLRRALTADEVRAIPLKGGPCGDVGVDTQLRLDGAVSPYPLYFLSHSDAGSVAMRDAFVASLKHDSLLLREVRAGVMSKNQIARYGPKGDLIQRALKECTTDYVIISDIDLRFFRAVSPIVQLYANSNADVIFQRDEDWSLTANLGFMALKCDDRVAHFFRRVAEMAGQYGRGEPVTDGNGAPSRVSGGDQRIVNQLLRHPEYSELPQMSWALFPTELMTKSIDQQRGMTYKHTATQVLYHLNDFGGASINPAKARENKVSMLQHHQDRYDADLARLNISRPRNLAF